MADSIGPVTPVGVGGSPAPAAPLAGFTIAVTAERRRDELSALLERRGAKVIVAPTITIVPLGDDQALHAATEACVGLAPDIVVATTGIGFRGWLEAAEGWGMGDTLRAALGRARLIARGAKPCGAIRAADLTEEWSAVTESSEEILERLLAQGVAGRRIGCFDHIGGIRRLRGRPQREPRHRDCHDRDPRHQRNAIGLVHRDGRWHLRLGQQVGHLRATAFGFGFAQRFEDE